MKPPKVLSWLLTLTLSSLLLLSGCSLPRVTAEARVFLNLSLEFLGEVQLPQTDFEATQVGGVSAITYDRQRNVVYALSDDRSQPRYYTLKLKLNQDEAGTTSLQPIEVERVTLLKNQQQEIYPSATLDPEGMALSPNQAVFISSEGVANQNRPPLIANFDLATGTQQQALPLSPHFLPAAENKEETDPLPQGVGDNLGFEALTLNPEGDRLFAATEFPLLQDYDADNPEAGLYNRLLHYFVGEPQSLLIAEHLYLLEPPPVGMVINSLTDLLSIDSGGHFLSLERAYSPLIGYSAQLFQIAMAGATDTSKVARLTLPLTQIKPVRKQPLLNLNQLDLAVGNLEGMTLGPMLPDGSRTLLLVSDNGFNAQEATQFLLFRLTQSPQSS